MRGTQTVQSQFLAARGSVALMAGIDRGKAALVDFEVGRAGRRDDQDRARRK